MYYRYNSRSSRDRTNKLYEKRKKERSLNFNFLNVSLFNSFKSEEGVDRGERSLGSEKVLFQVTESKEFQKLSG